MTESILYKNHLIKIEQDTDPVNPLTDWDHGCDVLVLHDRTTTEYGDGATLEHPPEFTRDEIKSSWKDIRDCFELDDMPITLLGMLNEYCPHYLNNYHNATDAFNETVVAMLESLSESDKLEAIAGLFNLKNGYVAHYEFAHGYTQSCYHHIVVVKSTDEYKNEDGILTDEAKQNAIKYCEGTAKTYKWWAYGDVHGYTVYGPMDADAIEDEEDEEDSDFREDLDSCWGFYGEYGSDDYNYVIQQAKDIIDHYEIERMEVERNSYTIKMVNNEWVELCYEDHILVAYASGVFQCGVAFRDTLEELFDYVDDFNIRFPGARAIKKMRTG